MHFITISDIYCFYILPEVSQPSIQKETKTLMHQVTTTHDIWLKGLLIYLSIYIFGLIIMFIVM